MTNNLERFTQRARQALQIAEAAAVQFQHPRIGSEHILFGMLLEGGGVAARVLQRLDLDSKAVEAAIRELKQEGERFPPAGGAELAPETKRLLEMSVEEARTLGHRFIGTEHLLLGMVAQDDCTAVSLLKHFNIDLELVRQNIAHIFEESAQTERANEARQLKGITERFTQQARRALSWAQEKAEAVEHYSVGAEYILLGLLCENHGIAARALRDLGLEQQRVEDFIKGMGDSLDDNPIRKNVRLTSSLDILELAVDEARRMGHPYVGTEHLLLGLMRQPESKAIDVLKHFGLTPLAVRQETKRIMQPQQVKPAPSADFPAPTLAQTASLHFHVIEQFIIKLLAMIEAKSLTVQQANELLLTLQPDFKLDAKMQAWLTTLVNQKQEHDARRVRIVVNNRETNEELFVLTMSLLEGLEKLDQLLLATVPDNKLETAAFESDSAPIRIEIHVEKDEPSE